MCSQSQTKACSPRKLLVCLKSSRPIIGQPVVGTIEVVGEELQEVYQKSDDVVLLLIPDQGNQPLLKGALVQVAIGHIFFKQPGNMDLDLAAKIARALATAAEILRRHFPDAQQSTTSSLVLTGGETLLGAVLIRLLRQTLGQETRILATTAGVNEQDLILRTDQLLDAGANYAIDAEAEDLVAHLQADAKFSTGAVSVDAVVDLTALAAKREGLKGLLSANGIFADCAAMEQASGQDGRELADLLDDQNSGKLCRLGEIVNKIPQEVLEYG